jgi:hypothetical protein
MEHGLNTDGDEQEETESTERRGAMRRHKMYKERLRLADCDVPVG